MGLPEIIIDFKTKSSTAIIRSSRGVVAMILKDDTDTNETRYNYTSLVRVDKEKFSEDSNDYIEQVFKDNLNKVIIERITEENTLEKALDNLSKESFNYLCYPASQNDDNQKIVSFIKEQRKKGKVFKAVLSNIDADYEGIINYISTCTDNTGKVYTPDKFVSRISGVLASMPFTRSSTYYELKDILDVENISDPSTEIDKGKLILIKDDGVVKISRGINSLITQVKSEDSLKKIRIVEILDMIKEDIYKTVKDNYIGKVSNTYDNKMICISTINSYLGDLVKDGILEGDNRVDIDTTAHKSYLMSTGKTEEEVNQMDETNLRKCNVGSNLYLIGSIKPVDCIEDIKINFSI